MYQKPAPEKWSRFMAPVLVEECVMGISIQSHFRCPRRLCLYHLSPIDPGLENGFEKSRRFHPSIHHI